MKSRFISVFLVLASVFLLAASCATDEDWVIPGQPISEPTPTETPVPTFAPTPALWDYTQVNQMRCDGTPLNSWRLPGIYSYNDSLIGISTYVEDGQVPYPDIESLNADQCGIYITPGLFFPGAPSPGSEWQRSSNCDDPTGIHHSQSLTVVIGEWEQKTTALGTLTIAPITT
jgi:hypothetical protein